jgi:hypothetical protein
VQWVGIIGLKNSDLRSKRNTGRERKFLSLEKKKCLALLAGRAVIVLYDTRDEELPEPFFALLTVPSLMLQ